MQDSDTGITVFVRKTALVVREDDETSECNNAKPNNSTYDVKVNTTHIEKLHQEKSSKHNYKYSMNVVLFENLVLFISQTPPPMPNTPSNDFKHPL